MHYSEEIKKRACELYMECGNFNMVKDQLEEEYEDTEEKIPTSATIRNWANQNNLPELMENIYVDVLKDARAKKLEEKAKRREEMKDGFQKAYLEAADSVYGANQKEFRNAFDAIRGMEIAAEMERKIDSELINQQFLEDVFMVIRRVVRDDDIMSEIGRELLKVLQRYGDA